MTTPTLQHKFTIGQSVWLVQTIYRKPRLVETMVTKVGTKWIHTLYGVKFDKHTLRTHSEHMSYGQVYLDPSVYEYEVTIRRMWSKLKDAVSTWEPPKGVTVSSIEDAITLVTPGMQQTEDHKG